MRKGQRGEEEKVVTRGRGSCFLPPSPSSVSRCDCCHFPAGGWREVRNEVLVIKWGSLPIPDIQKVLGLSPAMECTSRGGCLPLSACERIARRRKITFRPSAEEDVIPAHFLEPLDKGKTLNPLSKDEKWSPKKRQRLQQKGRDACGGMEETLWHMASSMEKKQRKVLAVDLEDFSTTQVPEVPQRCSLLQKLPSSKKTQVSFGNETKVSWSRNRQDSIVCRSLLPKIDSRPCQEPRKQLAPTCRKLRDQRLPLPRCRVSKRLQAKRQRLQNGVPLINGREGTWATPEEEAHRPISDLEDCQLTQDAGVGQELLENFPPPCRSDQRELPHQSSSIETPVPSDLHDQEHHTGPSSETSSSTSASTLLRPSRAPRYGAPRYGPWALAPVFQNMRSKLEAFADIFLSPSKPSLSPVERSPSPPPCPPENGDEAATTPPATPRPGVKIEVKIAISEPHSRKRSSCHEEEREETNRLVVSGRPPIRQWRLSQGEPVPQPHLGRSYSCPDFPKACSWQSVPSVLSSLPQLRQRRHTVCSLEVSRELGRPTLPCLRKEVYPFSSPPARLLPRPLVHTAHCDPSSYSSLAPSCCHEPDPAHPRKASLSPDGGQKVPAVGLGMVASEQLMLSEDEMKGSQENTVGKVSCIRIRKTPARHQANLTPMGLPRPARLNKKVFTLEEIYTNKNYHKPIENRSYETIFEVPLERKGALVFTSQRKLKRAIQFREVGLPRKQRKHHLLKGRRAKGRKAQPQSAEVEEMLQQKLAELDALSEEEDC